MSTIQSNDAQLRYVIEWFQEWSEMQRDDFLAVLVERCSPEGLVNGMLSGMENMSCKDESTRPPSIFQCRIKLFREWSQNWSRQNKDFLLNSIKNVDSKFMEKYEERVAGGAPAENEIENENENENEDEH